ncbi:hypothetical protein Agub_g14905 [Astrephomene gubernaculifera]|uniref:Uncharacterized protein n=1 Tax=Astrephomene gubernaculifera TaxID=47775 RepID=A0AAD3E292_9CHLO|nr:hypothetical protein Agub_g14905 [Astrephomene gubernaculifera]
MKRIGSSSSTQSLLRFRICSLRRALFCIFCTPLIFIVLVGRRQLLLEGLGRSGPKCIGWRATLACLPLGPRDPGGDLGCDQVVYGSAGYCLCEGGITTARVSCGEHGFRCQDKCAELGWEVAEAAARTTEAATAASEAGAKTAVSYTSSSYSYYDVDESDPFRLTGGAAGGAAAMLAAAGGDAKLLPKPLQCRNHQHHHYQPNPQQQDNGANGNVSYHDNDSLLNRQNEEEHQQQQRRRHLIDKPANSNGSSTATDVDVRQRDVGFLTQSASRVWDMVDELVGRHAPGDEVRVPGPRTNKADWVLEGRPVKPAVVRRLAEAVAGLMADLPPYPDHNPDDAADNDVHKKGSTADPESTTRSREQQQQQQQQGQQQARGSQGGQSPAAPAVFAGRGVVMVGGGLRYLTPAWVSLHVLRRSGCTLPVELWFPVEEFPPAALEEQLGRELGVRCRRLAARDLPQRGFGVKIAALLLSSFTEVLFLDSDNAVLRDPTYLFESPQYIATGALLWPDYWVRTAAPEVSQILNISNRQLPSGTYESGQMVIDKARHWRGLLVAAYLNVYGKLFSELLTCYVGKGDKETFAYGMLAAGEEFWTSPVPPGSAGVEAVVCDPPSSRHRRRLKSKVRHTHGTHHYHPHQSGGGWWWWLFGGAGGGSCHKQFLGNTMVQYDTNGAPLFFHANYHKWDLQLPDSFDNGWNRRWQLLQPHGLRVTDVLYGNGTTIVNTSSITQGAVIGAGYDIERFVYSVLVSLRCAPWFPAYYSARLRMGDPPQPPLQGFHPLPDYTTFRDYYRKGWHGNFAPIVRPPLTLNDHLTAWYYGGPRWTLRPWERRLRRWKMKLRSLLSCRG